ncbi:MAG: hypothetical protein ACK5M4_05515 [Pseudorhodobacter sp.]
MADDFKTHQSNLTSPAATAAEISPHNSQPLARSTRAIYVGGGGDLRVTFVDGGTVTLSAVPGGAIYPLRLSHVLATGTTATGLVGLS